MKPTPSIARAALLLACAAFPLRLGRSAVVWPDPPETARIRFERSLAPELVASKSSFLSKIWGLATGEKKRQAMTQPYGICVGSDGRVYVADTFGGAIHVFAPDGSKYSTLRVEGESLIGVAALGDRLFVTDSVRPSISCLDLRGHRQWTIGAAAGLLRPTGIVACGDRLQVVDTLGHCVFTVSLTGQVLARFGRHGRGPGEFNYPTNIARGPDGRLFVSDSMNFRVQTFAADGSYVSGFGKLGDGSGDFHRPKGIAVDGSGRIYVVEGLHDVIQIFDGDGRLLLFFGGSGGGEGELWLPTGIAIQGNSIYVSDSSNRRVQVYTYVGGEL